jgi:hypothetical protein
LGTTHGIDQKTGVGCRPGVVPELGGPQRSSASIYNNQAVLLSAHG